MRQAACGAPSEAGADAAEPSGAKMHQATDGPRGTGAACDDTLGAVLHHLETIAADYAGESRHDRRGVDRTEGRGAKAPGQDHDGRPGQDPGRVQENRGSGAAAPGPAEGRGGVRIEPPVRAAQWRPEDVA
jgi:hypothetical protein